MEDEIIDRDEFFGPPDENGAEQGEEEGNEAAEDEDPEARLEGRISRPLSPAADASRWIRSLKRFSLAKTKVETVKFSQEGWQNAKLFSGTRPALRAQ